MISKPKRFGTVFIAITYFIAVMVPLLSIVFSTSGTAYASGEQYAFYYDPSNAAAIKQAFSNPNPLDPSISSGLNDTSVYAEGGVFGSQPFAFTYDQNAGIFSQPSKGGALNVTYDSNSTLDCTINQNTPGNTFMKKEDITAPLPLPYTVHIPLQMTATLTPADIITGENTAHDVVNASLSIADYSTIGVTYSFQGTTENTTLSSYLNNLENAPDSFGSSTGDITSMLAQNCFPSGMNIKSAKTLFDSWSVSSAPVQLLNYVAMIPSAQKQWPGLQSSADIEAANFASNNPTPTTTTTPTTLNFVCNSGTDILGFIPNPLDWLLCGIINGMYLVVSNLDTQINNMLEIGTSNTTSDDPDQIFADTNSCPAGISNCATYQDANAYQTAWQQFRNIALALLVIVALTIVIAQALGMELLDAYTIRKMLPRFLIATIAITLSWSIMRFLVTLSNDLGFGIGNLLSAPFSKIGIDIKFSTGGSILATAVAGGALAVFDLVGLLGFVGTAAIAVLVTFVVLIIRQIAVILLIILAPVAMIAYILPGTQRVYKFWWESLSKMLLMFPMIVGLITAGHIFAAIASSNAKTAGGTTQLADTCIAIFAYFAPYFMVPMTFRFSGAMMGTIGGAVNARGDSARGVLRNFRSGRVKKNLAGMKSGTRWEDKPYLPTRLTKALDNTTAGIGTGWKGRFGLGERGQSARGYVLQAAAAEAQKTQGMQGIKGNNKANRILAMANGDEAKGHAALVKYLEDGGDDGVKMNHTDAVAAADRAAKDAKAAGGFTKAHAAAAFLNMAQDGTAIKNTDDLAMLAATVGDGDRNTTFHYAATAASISRQVGRPSLAAASEPIGALAFAYSDDIHKKTPGRAGSLSDGKTSISQLEAAAWESGAGGEVMYNKLSTAKSRDIRNDTREAVKILQTHKEALESGQVSPYSPEQVRFAAANLVETQTGIDNNYGKINNRKVAGEEMEKGQEALDYYLDTEVPSDAPQRRPKPEQVDTNPDGTPVLASPIRPKPVKVDTNPDGSPVLASPIYPPRVTNRDVVKKMVGDRFSNMTPEQRKMAEINREQEDQNP
jgi:hypothetical protein